MSDISLWPELGWGLDITPRWKRGPRGRTIPILDRALEIVETTPYVVTSRFVFYILWQEGYYAGVRDTERASAKKLAYQRWVGLTSRLRHSPLEFQERWPLEFADDRRSPVIRTSYMLSTDAWLDDRIEHIECMLEKMVGQDNYVIVAFEAEAMLSQFRYLTQDYHVSLWPFSGKASIPYKKRLVRFVEYVTDLLELPVVILYFGDYDPAGREIPETAFCHIRKWSRWSFDAYRVGLNEEHVLDFDLTEDPERPGRYQWEALTDEDHLRSVVHGSLDAFLDRDLIKDVLHDESEMTHRVRQALSELRSSK